MTYSNVVKTSKNFEKIPDIVPCKTLLRRVVRILRITGMLSANSVFTDTIGKSSIWESVILITGVTQLSLLLWFVASQMVDRWAVDPDRAVDPSAGSVTCCLCIVKLMNLWLNRKEFRNLLRHVVIMWEDSNRRTRIRKEIAKIAKRTYHWEKWYIINVVIACLSYALRPYAFLLRHHLYEKPHNISYDSLLTVYPGKYFWTTDTMGKYIMCVCWEQSTVLLVGLSVLSVDCIFAQLTTHAGIEFRVLQHDLKYLASSSDKYGDEKNERILIEQLTSIVKRHRDLYRHWGRIKKIFGAIIFLTMLLTAANTCLCAFQLQKEISHKNWTEVVRNLWHVLIIGVQSVLYCGYADELVEQSNLVAQAAYECQWMDRSKEFKIMLRIIIMRAQRPLDCTIYGLVSPNLSQVMLIFKAAASYFTLLKSLT